MLNRRVRFSYDNNIKYISRVTSKINIKEGTCTVYLNIRDRSRMINAYHNFHSYLK